MPGPRDLEATFTLKDDVSKTLRVIEDNTKKTTDTLEKEGEKTRKSFNLSALGAVALAKAIGLIQRAIQQSELVKLGIELLDVGGAIDDILVKAGKLVGIFGDDTTAAGLKAAASIEKLRKEVDKAREAVDNLLEAQKGKNVFAFSVVSRGQGALGLQQSVDQTQANLDNIVNVALQKARARYSALSVELANAETGLGQDFAAATSAFLQNAATSTDEAKEDFAEINRRIVEAAGNVEVLDKALEKTFRQGFREKVDEFVEQFENVANIGRTVAEDLQVAFSDGFFDAFETGFSDLEATAKGVFDSILRAAYRLIADLAATQILKLLAGGVAQIFSQTSGGPVQAFVDPFGNGGQVGGPGFETPVGAGSAGATSPLGRFGGGIGGGVAPIVVNYAPVVQAIDDRGVAEFYRRTRGDLMATIEEGVRRSARSQRNIRGR